MRRLTRKPPRLFLDKALNETSRQIRVAVAEQVARSITGAPIAVPAVDRELDDAQEWEASVRASERRRILAAVLAIRFEGTNSHSTPDTFYAGVRSAASIIEGMK